MEVATKKREWLCQNIFCCCFFVCLFFFFFGFFFLLCNFCAESTPAIMIRIYRVQYCGFGNFRVTFISLFFHFRIIRKFLNSQASIRVVGHFRGFKIGTLRISHSCERKMFYRIAVHFVRQLKLELYSSFCPHKETITQFVTQTDRQSLDRV